MARRYPGPRKIRDRADLGVYARWAGDPVSWAGMPLPPRSRRIVEGSVIHVSGPAGDMDERATATRWNLPEPYRAVFVTRVRRPGFRSSPHSFCAVSVTSERAFARLSHVQQRGPRTRPWTCALRWRPTLRTSSTSGWAVSALRLHDETYVRCWSRAWTTSGRCASSTHSPGPGGGGGGCALFRGPVPGGIRCSPR